MINRLAVTVFSALLSAMAVSAEYRKETTLSVLEAHATPRPASPSTENREFVSFGTTTPWIFHGGSVGITCREGVAVLPQDNNALRAIALSAIATSATVNVIVDSSLPAIGDICQITVLSIRSN